MLRLCAEGKLYEIEAWIADGNPIQFKRGDDRISQRTPSALQIAVRSGFHSLASLLLANGYDASQDGRECLLCAVRARRHDFVDLLLNAGVDPDVVDFCTVLETCDRPLMDRFVEAGIDPCRNNAVACALASKLRPVLGFIKQYRERFPELQQQIDIALFEFTAAEDVRGVALMLWLGANPHARTAAFDRGSERGGTDTAFVNALLAKKSEVLAMVAKHPIPKSELNALFPLLAYANNPALVRRFLQDGADPNCHDENGDPLIWSFLCALLWRFAPPDADGERRGLEALGLVVAAGARWRPDPPTVRRLRRYLAQSNGSLVRSVLELLKNSDVLSAAELHELTRTPTMRRMLMPYAEILPDTPAKAVARAKRRNQLPKRRTEYWMRHWSKQGKFTGSPPL